MLPNINNGLPLDKTALIAFFLEACLYGVSVLLFGITLWVLVYHRRRERFNKCLVVISCLMMFFGTVHMAINLTRIFQGFIDHGGESGGPIGYFSQLFLWSYILKTAILVAQTVLADSFTIYRCWVILGRLRAVTVPALFVVGTFVTGVGIVHGCAVSQNGENVFSSSLAGWIISFFILTLATSIVCTSLIALRIWYTTRNVSRCSGPQSLMSIVVIVVDSGAIYSTSCISILMAYVLGSNVQYMALDGVVPVIPIAFNLIILRVAAGIAYGGTSTMRSTQYPIAFGGIRSYGGYTTYPLKPLVVTVSQITHQGVDQDEIPVKDHESFANEGTAKKVHGMLCDSKCR